MALELASPRGRKSPEVVWEDLLANLEREVAVLEALEDQTKPWKKKRKEELGLEASLQLSLRASRDESEEAYRSFIWLGALRDDATLTAPMASALWDFQGTERADRLLEFLWGEAVLQPAAAVRVGDIEWAAYRLHDLLHDCAGRLLETPQTPTRQDSLPGLGLTRPEAHRKLLERFRKRTRDGLWHTVAADGYIHGRLGWHLEKAGDFDGLHALLREETAQGRNGWYEANERLGQPSVFADSVAHAWHLADEAFRDGKPALGLQCRYALITASLNSLAGNVPTELLACAGREPRLDGGAGADLRVRQTPDRRQRVSAYLALLPHVPHHNRTPVLYEALQAAGNSAFELEELAPHLPNELLSEALEAARSIPSADDRSGALAALTPQLPEELRGQVLSEALKAARAIPNEQYRFRALEALAPHLPGELLSEGLQAACSIQQDEHRARAWKSWRRTFRRSCCPRPFRPPAPSQTKATATVPWEHWRSTSRWSSPGVAVRGPPSRPLHGRRDRSLPCPEDTGAAAPGGVARAGALRGPPGRPLHPRREPPLPRRGRRERKGVPPLRPEETGAAAPGGVARAGALRGPPGHPLHHRRGRQLPYPSGPCVAAAQGVAVRGTPDRPLSPIR